jgi:hypothetical protein
VAAHEEVLEEILDAGHVGVIDAVATGVVPTPALRHASPLPEVCADAHIES